MIEAIVIDYLKGRTSAGDNVDAEIPEERSGTCIVVEKTGSMTKDRITTSTIAVQSYGEHMIDAIRLNEEVKGIMEQLPELDKVSSCKLNSDYNFTDQSTKQYRYQAVFQITHF